jgi:hypothetical protein
MSKTTHVMIVWLIMIMQTTAPVYAQADLAKESQNPIGNIISVPFENNFDFGVGTEDAFVYALNLKPVYPVDLGDLNLINRAILPIIYQEERFKGEGTEFGLGNFTYQAFFSPAKPGKIIPSPQTGRRTAAMKRGPFPWAGVSAGWYDSANCLLT